jgi:hypothetical protein
VQARPLVHEVRGIIRPVHSEYRISSVAKRCLCPAICLIAGILWANSTGGTSPLSLMANVRHHKFVTSAYGILPDGSCRVSCWRQHEVVNGEQQCPLEKPTMRFARGRRRSVTCLAGRITGPTADRCCPCFYADRFTRPDRPGCTTAERGPESSCASSTSRAASHQIVAASRAAW